MINNDLTFWSVIILEKMPTWLNIFDEEKEEDVIKKLYFPYLGFYITLPTVQKEQLWGLEECDA